MALICVSGGRECDGCMECIKDGELVCEWCGCEITNEDYFEYDGRCEFCFDDL